MEEFGSQDETYDGSLQRDQEAEEQRPTCTGDVSFLEKSEITKSDGSVLQGSEMGVLFMRTEI